MKEVFLFILYNSIISLLTCSAFFITTSIWNLGVITIMVFLLLFGSSFTNMSLISYFIIMKRNTIFYIANRLISKPILFMLISFLLSKILIELQVIKHIVYLLINIFSCNVVNISYILVLTEILSSTVISSSLIRGNSIIIPMINYIISGFLKQDVIIQKIIISKEHLSQICFYSNSISGNIFINSALGNYLILNIVYKIGIEIGWKLWLLTSLVPNFFCLILIPRLLYLNAKGYIYINNKIRKNCHIYIVSYDIIYKVVPLFVFLSFISVRVDLFVLIFFFF